MPDDQVIDAEYAPTTLTTISDDDSPPADQIPDINQITHKDSSAEPEEVIVRGKGRPRKDGLPNTTAKMGPPPTPSPKFKRYYSASVRTDQNPVYYLKWHHELPKWAKDRLVVYVYRLWPALKMVEDMNGELDTKYIDKLAEPPRDLMELQDRYGAGDYQLVVNDDVQEKRTIAELWVKEGFRDVVHFPPTDRRIDDVDNVDLEAQENKSYIQYLKSKGKLPEQQTAKGREADMAEATALKEMTGFMREVVNKSMDKRDDRGTNDTTATVVKEIMGVMGEVNKQAASVMENAYKKTQQEAHAPAPVVDPIDTLDKVLSVMDKIRPAASGDSETIKLLLSQMNKQQERFEELMKEMKNGGQAQSQAQTNPLSTTSDTIKTVVELVTTLGFKAPGAAAATVMGGADGPWYKDPETIQNLLQYGSQMVSSVAQAFTTKMQIDARMQAQQMGMGMGPQPQPQPSNQFYQPPPQGQPQPQPQTQTQTLPPPHIDPTIIQPDPAQAQEMTTEQQAELQDFYQFMAFIHEPLMNHIDQALGGDRFAEWLIDSKRDGAARYRVIKNGGAEALYAGLRMYEPLWSELEPKQSLLPQFVDEFMRMEEIRAEEERRAQEGDEEEEEEVATGD